MIFESVDITLYIIFQTILVLVLVYFLIRLLSFLVSGLSLPSKQKNRLEYTLKVLKNSFIPITLFVVAVLLCFWKPIYLGLPAILGLVFFFNPLKNFLQGFLIRGKSNLNIRTYLRVNTVQGRIEAWNFAGVKLATKNGVIMLPYQQLVDGVYEVLDQGESLNTIQFSIKKTSDSKINVVDHLASSPFIKINTKISIHDQKSNEEMTIALIPRSDLYLEDIQSIINDAGYTIV